MSNPYTPASLTGYNANPPSDDGALEAQNAVKWSNHIDKIGDPLKTFMESVNVNVLAGFESTFGSAVRELTTDYTVILADRGRFLSISGVTTITMITALLAGSGFPIAIANNGSEVVTVSSSDLINGSATVTLQPGEGVIISCDGTTWAGTETLAKKAGSFVSTWVGFTTSPTTTWNYTRVGNIVTLRPTGGVSAVSNANGFLSGADLPAIIRPTGSSINVLYRVIDNAITEIGVLSVSSLGVISFSKIDGTVFITSGTKGFIGGQAFTYALD